ncbi:MAG TPA: DUF58 domain-containing protein [Verrucomicrobiota bacterium]|nr:DUF58 domain-containing protein [Verrucomicrobiota bacterium]
MSIPKEWLKKIRVIELRTLKLVENLMSGKYHSVFKGRGIDFDEVREYVAGDDVRRIDWNVTARTGKPYVKKYVEERELTVMLLVDASASGSIGSINQSKRELAAEVAALLGFSAIANNDRVGMLLFTDHTERYMSPSKGRIHMLGIISLILTHKPKSKLTDIATALNHLNYAISRRAVIFILSDFMDSGYERALKVLARKHDVIAVPVIDPIELEIPDIGLLTFEDSETGEIFQLKTSDPKVREVFSQYSAMRVENMRQTLRSCGVDTIEVSTDKPYLDSFNKFFETRYHRINPQ